MKIKIKLLHYISLIVVLCYGQTSIAVTGLQPITHFVIQHATNGSNCIPVPITVSAYSNSVLAINFNSTIKLDTKTGKGSWTLLSGHGQLLDTITDDGIAYYSFAPQDGGQASFELFYPNGPSPIKIAAQLQTNKHIHDNGSAGQLMFSATGFLFTSVPISRTIPSTTNIARYSNTQIAGVAVPIYITAFGQTHGLSCTKMDTYSGIKTLNFWQNYINPTSGTITTAVNGINIGTSITKPVAIRLKFTKGTSKFMASYSDVGKIQLNALSHIAAAQRQHANSDHNNIVGSTKNYVVKPASLTITNVPNNPQAATAADAIFVKAGDNFTVDVTAQDYQGNTTPNYGNEIVPAGIQLIASTLVAPINGQNGSQNDGSIGNSTAFTKISPGVFRGTEFYFDEVGIIKLQAMVANGDYLEAGNIIGPESPNIGRFSPHHFTVAANVPMFNSGCASGKFTYIGQPFTYNIPPVISITAEAKRNTTTKNYINDFWKMLATNITVNYKSNSQLATLNTILANTDVTIIPANNGTGEIKLGDAGGISFDKVNNTNIPLFGAEIQANINIQDSDNVAYLNNPYLIGDIKPHTGIPFSNGNSMLQGRISLDNNFGSELLPLTIPTKIQFFNGKDYVLNVNDSCTTITDHNYVHLAEMPIDLITTTNLKTFVDGIGSIILAASKQPGNVDVTLNLSVTGANLPYLQHDWPQNGGNGSFSDNPMARGTFGIYHGNDKIIYTEEKLD